MAFACSDPKDLKSSSNSSSSVSTDIRNLGNKIFKFAIMQPGSKPRFEKLKVAIKHYNEALNASNTDEERSFALKNLGIAHLYCARTFIDTISDSSSSQSSENLYQLFYYYVEGFEYLGDCYCKTALSNDWKVTLLQKLYEGMQEAFNICSQPEKYPNRLKRLLEFQKYVSCTLFYST
jgi:DNA-directed RNA polymerase subunit N (RpoN/RPB10)